VTGPRLTGLLGKVVVVTGAARGPDGAAVDLDASRIHLVV